MSRQQHWLRRGLGGLAALCALVLVAAQPAQARDGHRHHHGSDAFFSFGFNSAPYYYDPYPYGPAYAYPPAYAYGPPPYAYDGGGYDQEPTYDYDGGGYADSGPDNGPYCREFQTTVVIDGRPQSAHGTACQQPDGTWAVVH
jgi:hypothetical protein